MGYGLLEVTEGKPQMLEMGVLQLSKYDDHAKRLSLIFTKVTALIALHRPAAVAVEAPFFGKNVQSMLKLGRAQGVALAAAMNAGLNITEYAPRKIKQSVTGNGNATKEQVWAMLQHILNVTSDPGYFDATDAVAVALCHHYQNSGPLGQLTEPAKKGKKTKSGSWEAYLANNPDRIC
ncbi:MAG: crossover junction endodeoxyribonuclease RuvC [Chitinophagia bacterium]|nr:crossover junction endodeoxyribonuclease RuvC [Chitinophagia bacterium]